MDLFISESIVDGFTSGETDLNAIFARDPAQRDDFIATIIDNIVDVLNSQPDAGASLSLSGHSDRDDTAGRTHIQHLAVELAASEDRVTSLNDVVNQMVQARVPSAPADLNDLAFFDVHLRAFGAVNLVNDGPVISEDQARQNRRIQARLLVYKPTP